MGIKQKIAQVGRALHLLPKAESKSFQPKQRQKSVKANSYEISLDGDVTKYLFNQADLFPADAAARSNIRAMIRKRARFTYQNNGYSKGMVDSKARDTIGRGPRLQFQSNDKDINSRIERDWNKWSREINLNEKLRVVVTTRILDGEIFIVTVTNPIRKLVKLDIQLIEADRVNGIIGEDQIDGIHFDKHGNPLSYDIMKHYVSSSGVMSNFDLNPHELSHKGPKQYLTNYGLQGDFENVPAENCFHNFQPVRAGQHRGVSEISTSIMILELLRRYTHSTVITAERAACFGILLENEAPIDTSNEENPVSPDVNSEVELSPGNINVLPAGMKPHEFKAEQPTTQYPAFKKELLEESARPLNESFNIASGNSSGYNYASGRLDHQTYFKTIDIDRQQLSITILDKLFDKWYQEWILLPENSDIRMATKSNEMEESHEWYWDGHEHVDPAKEAGADDTRLKNGTLTVPQYWAGRGYDWRDKLAEQLTYEEEVKKQREERGLPQLIPSTVQVIPDATQTTDDGSEPVEDPADTSDVGAD